MLEFLTRLREADEKARGLADGALARCGGIDEKILLAMRILQGVLSGIYAEGCEAEELQDFAKRMDEVLGVIQSKSDEHTLIMERAKGGILTTGELKEALRKAFHPNIEMFFKTFDTEGREGNLTRVGSWFFRKKERRALTICAARDGKAHTADSLLGEIYWGLRKGYITERSPVLLWEKGEKRPSHYAVSVIDYGGCGEWINLDEGEIDLKTLKAI